MLTSEENEILCRVGPGTAMGGLMRAHWVPVCLSEEVAEADGPPLLVEALGERFVAFRDSEGRLGLLDELCPHRRASLVLGRNEECGLRCLYHGWKIDVEGHVVTMASEPPDSPMQGTVRHRAYPVQEAGGFVWAWLGAGEAPAFRPPAFAPTGAERVSILKIRVPANWAQITEGQIDSAHSSSLHSSDMVPARVEGAAADDKAWYRPSTDRAPRLQSACTAYGFHYAAIRRPIRNAATHEYIRVTEYIAPFLSLIPPNSSYRVASLIVPVDDATTHFHFIAWGDPETTPSTTDWRAFNHAVPGDDLDTRWVPWRAMDPRFGQDRVRMKAGSFTGIEGIPNQDIAMWASMGAIVDRSRDVLGSSDLAIVEFRRLMVEAAHAASAGEVPLGTGAGVPPHTAIASFEGVVPKGSDWEALAQGAAAGLAAARTG